MPAQPGRCAIFRSDRAGAILIVGGTLDLLTWWLRQPNPLPIKRIVEIHENVVVAPVIEASSATKRRKAKK